MESKKIYIPFLFAFFLIGNSSQAQENQSHKTLTQKEIDAEKLRKQEEADKIGKERHMGIQTKRVRKRMKKSAKQARRNNERREEFILLKLFRRH